MLSGLVSISKPKPATYCSLIITSRFFRGFSQVDIFRYFKHIYLINNKKNAYKWLSKKKHTHIYLRGKACVIHAIRDLPNIFNVNCDLHIFSMWNVIHETWCVIYYLRDLWLRHHFPYANYTNPPKLSYERDIIYVGCTCITMSTLKMIPYLFWLFLLGDFRNCRWRLDAWCMY